MTGPLVGVVFHWLGGLASASFYLPYKGIRRWSWETYWLVGGIFSWIVAPLVFAIVLVPDLAMVLSSAPVKVLAWVYLFGALWGIGGLTFGLTVRYLGIALGMAVALGFCAVFGTLIPPLVNGELPGLLATASGRAVITGVLASLVGIAVSAMAGMARERELTGQQKIATGELNFARGILVATFSGIMSSCFAFGLAAGKPLAEVSKGVLLSHGRLDVWQNLPVLVVVLWGGFTTNFLWCVALNIKNRSGSEYLTLQSGDDPASLAINYGLSASAGLLWYLQFFFYSVGQTKMGHYEFSSWTLHMCSIITFSTLWGFVLREWKGTSLRTRLMAASGLAALMGATLIVGYGNFLATP